MSGNNKCLKTVKAPMSVISACSTVLPYLWNTDVNVNDFIEDKTPYREERKTIREFLIKESADFYYCISYNNETTSFNFVIRDKN